MKFETKPTGRRENPVDLRSNAPEKWTHKVAVCDCSIGRAFCLDETQIDAKRRFKVLCSRGRIPLSCMEMKLPHLTGCVTISAAGRVLKPLIILKSKQKLDNLSEFCDASYFATSESGWMTMSIFTYWTICFIAEIQIYRLSLPPDLRDARILLVMDGHSSRANYDAAWLFDLFNIDLLILPGHCSHVLQAFDIGIGGPLKTAFQLRRKKEAGVAIEKEM